MLDLAVQTSLAVVERDFMHLQPHPAACMFPMMSGGEYASLVASIRRDGLHVPLVLHEGMILDGRNRYRACQEAGVAPRFVELKPGENPYRYVWIHNGERRNLEPFQRVAILMRIDRAADDYDAKRVEKSGRANAKRSKATKAQARSGDGRRLTSTPAYLGGPAPGAMSTDRAPGRNHASPSADDLAVRANVSPATAARVQALANKRPDLLDQVADGELRFTEAMRQAKRQELKEHGVAPLPAGKYRVIYADPPWQYSDTREGLKGYSASAAEDQYPTMSVSQLAALEVGELAGADAVLFCWATFPLLPDALEVVRAWGFKYKTAFVWQKGRANFGHYHDASAELLLVCTRGSGVPDSDKRESQVQSVKHPGKHSEKPEEFRALIERLYTRGPRIELFRRGAAPKGWKVWGNEADDVG